MKIRWQAQVTPDSITQCKPSGKCRLISRQSCSRCLFKCIACAFYYQSIEKLDHETGAASSSTRRDFSFHFDSTLKTHALRRCQKFRLLDIWFTRCLLFTGCCTWCSRSGQGCWHSHLRYSTSIHQGTGGTNGRQDQAIGHWTLLDQRLRRSWRRRHRTDFTYHHQAS